MQKRFRPLIGVIIFQLIILGYQFAKVSLFPSPYRGYHLSTNIPDIDYIVGVTGFRPLIGVIIFQQYLPSVLEIHGSFRPLIGVIIFQQLDDVLSKAASCKFSFRPLIGVIIFQLFGGGTQRVLQSFRFRPLIGVIIFQPYPLLALIL